MSMRVSNLIKKLQHFQEHYGDLNVLNKDKNLADIIYDETGEEIFDNGIIKYYHCCKII